MRDRPRPRAALPGITLLIALITLLACGSDRSVQPPEVTLPTPDPGQVIPGSATGPTGIRFVSASPPPGSAVEGCGDDIGGCAGRVRIALSLAPSRTGPALRLTVFLHDTGKKACLFGSTGAFSLSGGETKDVEVTLDRFDKCATPVEIANMAAVVEGTVEVASRQEWALRYSFLR